MTDPTCHELSEWLAQTVARLPSHPSGGGTGQKAKMAMNIVCATKQCGVQMGQSRYSFDMDLPTNRDAPSRSCSHDSVFAAFMRPGINNLSRISRPELALRIALTANVQREASNSVATYASSYRPTQSEALNAECSIRQRIKSPA